MHHTINILCWALAFSKIASRSLIISLLTNHNTINMKASIVSASLFAAAVSAHGNITFPPARQAGAAMAAVCGQDAVDTINADPTIPLEDVTAASTQCE